MPRNLEKFISDILPESDESYYETLKRFAKGIEQRLYSQDIADPNELYQGDIVHSIPICFTDEDGDLVELTNTVILISHTCDMQPGRTPFIVCSPIVPLSEYREQLFALGKDRRAVENTLDAIRKNKNHGYFYLPPKVELEESYADFSTMVSVSSVFLNRLKQEEPERFLCSLSQEGSYFFLMKLVHYLARIQQENE